MFHPNDLSLKLNVHFLPFRGLWDTKEALTKLHPSLKGFQALGDLKGNFQWAPTHSQGNLFIEIKKGFTTGKSLQVENLTASIFLSSLFPLKNQPQQLVRIKRAYWGSELLENIKIEWDYGIQPGLRLHKAEAQMMGGLLSLRPYLLSSSSTPYLPSFEAALIHIQLNDLIRFLEISHLSAEGRLSGTAFLQKKGSHLHLQEAHFHLSSDNSILRYTPPSTRHDHPLSEGFPLEALKEMHVNQLEITLKSHNKEFKAHSQLLGFNPHVLNGYPFHFDVTTSGPLKNLFLKTIQAICSQKREGP